MSEYRVLLIAADQAGIDSSREFNTLSNVVRVLIHSGHQDYDTLYQTVSRNSPDAIMFIGHSETDENPRDDRLRLSGTSSMKQDQVTALVDISGASLVIINACNSALIGTYVGQNSQARAVIFTTLDIHDETAWQFPERFFRHLAGSLSDDGVRSSTLYQESYRAAISPSRDGKYSFFSLEEVIPQYVTLLREFRTVKAILAKISQDLVRELGLLPVVDTTKEQYLRYMMYSIISISIVVLLAALVKMSGVGG